ncbi:MAG: homocysteine S-methyltransferase family protein [Bdellovibrionia bacterium]
MRKSTRVDPLFSALRRRVLVLDGAMGTRLQAEYPESSKSNESTHLSCSELLNLTHPLRIATLHRAYLQVGCDIIQTHTFSADPLSLRRLGLEKQSHSINLAAAQIAKQVAIEFSTPSHPRFVAGVLGPTPLSTWSTPLPPPSQDPAFLPQNLTEAYFLQAQALWDGGVDFLLFETTQDIRSLRCGLAAVQALSQKTGESIPVAASVTLEPQGVMLSGQNLRALLASLTHWDLLYLGINCGTGAEFMTDALATLATHSPFPVACVPNAGFPDASGYYLESPSTFSHVMSRFLSHGWVNLVGGCCGTTESHLEALVKVAQTAPARPLPLLSPPPIFSGLEACEIKTQSGPRLVPPTLSPLSLDHSKSVQSPGASHPWIEQARIEIQAGAHFIPLELDPPDHFNFNSMKPLIQRGCETLRAPFLFISQDLQRLTWALHIAPGKSLILYKKAQLTPKDLETLLELHQNLGAGIVLPLKLSSPTSHTPWSPPDARTIDAWLKNPRVDPKHLVIHIQWMGNSSLPSFFSQSPKIILALQRIRQTWPQCLLALSGIDPKKWKKKQLLAETQEALASLWTHFTHSQGVDLHWGPWTPLVPKEKLPTRVLRLAQPLFFSSTKLDQKDAWRELKTHFAKSTENHPNRLKPTSLSPDERLKNLILSGSKEGIHELIEASVKRNKASPPLQDTLLEAMNEVGRRYANRSMILSEVLQSAEVMKIALGLLQEHLPPQETPGSKKKVLLATPHGDVHEIGKNLVSIILANTGFEVIDLGTQITSEQLIAAIAQHQPDLIALSGLLMKSAHEMLNTAHRLTQAGISTPLLVGGAAVSQKFVHQKLSSAYPQGTVVYAENVMHGLQLAQALVDPDKHLTLKQSLEEKRAQPGSEKPRLALRSFASPQIRSTQIAPLPSPPEPLDFRRHVLDNTPLDQIWAFVNPLMLYGRHLGIRGATVRLFESMSHEPETRRLLEKQEPQAVKIWDAVEEIKSKYRNTEILRPRGIFQFFRAHSQGNQIQLFPEDHNSLLTSQRWGFEFPRQRIPDGLCLADYVSPALLSHPTGSTPQDSVALFIVTIGRGVRELAESLKSRGDYFHSHLIQALALESAEAYAEWVHAKIRKAWGFADPPEMTLLEKFQSKYRGKRYSFGYPACPRLEDQAQLFEILNPNDIGVTLTDGWMMEPEASISALVFHHPQCSYFSVGQTALDGVIGEGDEDKR